MPASTSECVRTLLTSEEALKIARLDAETAYRDLLSYRASVDLAEDGWHVDYELKNRESQGGGAHYVIDAQTGVIRSKRYEQ
jgi:hypothetical protein